MKWATASTIWRNQSEILWNKLVHLRLLFSCFLFSLSLSRALALSLCVYTSAHNTPLPYLVIVTLFLPILWFSLFVRTEGAASNTAGKAEGSAKLKTQPEQ